MEAVKKKIRELIDVLPLRDEDKKELSDFLLTKDDADLTRMLYLFVDNLALIKFYWRLKRPKR